MKTTIRLISLLLVVLFVLCSCQSSAPEIVPEYDSRVEAADLDGFKVTWGHCYTDTIYGFIDGTAHSDMALERERTIEDTMNCTIEVEYSGDTVYSTLRASVMSGQPYYDLVTAGTFGLVNDVRAGYLTGLSSLLDVENTDKWGTPNMLNSTIWKDDVYAVVPYAWPEVMYYSSFGYPISVNEDLIARLGVTDPREYVESLTWTWDKFEECLAAYTHDDGGRTIYGMATHSAYFAMMMFLSNGNTLSSYENGEVVCGAYTDSGFEALERARKIYFETCKDYFHPGDPWNYAGVDMFINGEMVLLTAPCNELFGTSKSLLYLTDNVGLIPYPQGPNATPGEYPSYHESLDYATGIPVNAKDPEATAIILDAMYEPFDEYKNKEDIVNYMAEQIFFDERDAGVLANMLKNTEYGFFLEGARGVIESVTSADNATITSLLESNESKYQQIVDDYMVHHYEGTVAVYGE
ncbi:MAG: extracellular solute-binding protein [Clostridia bacterium]|nr:extracellular solute-binding protein [Clostridia bacterium]